MALAGSCLCGAIEWSITGSIELAHYCHCTMCRKMHGTGAGVFGAVSETDFAWRRGPEARRAYRTSATNARWYCGICGSPTPGDAHNGRVGVVLGSLEGTDIEIKPRARIFVDSKAAWDEISDQLRRFGAWPPGYDLPVFPDPVREPASAGSVNGSCLCGEVAFSVQGPLRSMYHCHCSRCRKLSGTAHATNASTTPASFRWLRGEQRVHTFKVPDARFFSNAFCEGCGAKLPRVSLERDKVTIPAGSFDGDPGLRPTEHIFVGSKASWLTIGDALPQHAERP